MAALVGLPGKSWKGFEYLAGSEIRRESSRITIQIVNKNF